LRSGEEFADARDDLNAVKLDVRHGISSRNQLDRVLSRDATAVSPL
jgi:hypothetical protein